MARKKSFLLRARPEIMGALQKWADDELRSVNAQIEYVLRGALRKAGRLPSPDADPAASEPDKENELDRLLCSRENRTGSGPARSRRNQATGPQDQN